MTTFSPATYIIDRDPMKYGGKQEDYEKRMGALVALGIKRIKETPKEESKLVALFFELLKVFENERHAIALDHRTTHGAKFGTRRDLEGVYDFYHTFLDQQYTAYNTKILDMFAKHMQGMALDRKNSTKKSKKIEDTYLDRASSLEIEILEGTDLDESNWRRYVSEEEWPSTFPKDLLMKREKGQLKAVELQTIKEAMRNLKKENPKFYQRCKMSVMFKELQEEFPSPKAIYSPDRSYYQLDGEEKNLKSFFLLATARLKINGKMYAISQYLTWLYRDFKESPIERMKKCSTVCVIHQDNFLINELLQDIAKIFAKAVLCDKQNFDELQSLTGLFRFCFAHNMPDERGSASIGEVYEGCIYGSKNMGVAYNKEYMVDLEALTTPLLSQFMKNYPSMLFLTSMIKANQQPV
jgi:hypothetical protein